MTWTPLASSWAKYHRACTHLKDLQKELARVLNTKADPIVIETKVKHGSVAAVVTRLPNFRDAGLILGDALVSFRAALDHLAWDLVKLGSRPRPKAPHEVKYPMARSWKSLRDQRSRCLPGVGDTEFGIIRRYQPYKRGETARALRLLRDLSDKDKHRYITPTVMYARAFAYRIGVLNCVLHGPPKVVYRPGHALHVGMKLVTATALPLAPDYDVKVQGQIACEPSLGRSTPLGNDLAAVRAVVLEILGIFDART